MTNPDPAVRVQAISLEGRQWICEWLKRWRLEFGGNDEPRALAELFDILAAMKAAELQRLAQTCAQLRKEKEEAIRDVQRMAATKVGEKCEHHKSSVDVLEWLAIRECPICWKECAEQAEAERDTLRTALETLETEWRSEKVASERSGWRRARKLCADQLRALLSPPGDPI